MRWNEILDKQMLCRRGKHYYVREGSLSHDTINGMKEARNMLKGLLLAGNKEIDNSELPPGLVAIASIITRRTDPKIIDINENAIREEISKGIEGLGIKTDTKNELLERLQLSEKWDEPISADTMEEVCRAIGTSLVAVGPNQRTLVSGAPGSLSVMRDFRGECTVSEIEAEPCSPKERLRTIFWNSNGWIADKGQKIADLAAIEGANILGITDTRIKMTEMGKKLSTLLFFLEVKTKLKCRGKVFPMINGAESGGTIIAVSDRFMDAKFTEVLPGGILTSVKRNWGYSR